MNVIEVTKKLIACQSVTPEDDGCQALLTGLLAKAGFTIKSLESNGVRNFYAWHGSGAPLLIFCGHTDVVPAGPLKNWESAPFSAVEKNGMLYGRGAADMKSAVAAMVVSAIHFVEQHPDHAGTVALAITGDEEGIAVDGSTKIVDYLKAESIKPDYVLVGEPSSERELADTIKIGRRGSMYGDIRIIGKQGHIAYPQQSDNAIHRSLKALDALVNINWGAATRDFPATSLQFYDIQSGVGATNVVPGLLTAKFNCRFSPADTPDSLQQKINAVLNCHDVCYEIDYKTSSLPFFSGECDLSRLCQQASEKICGRTPRTSTEGGTSDGRFFSAICSQVVELGVVNETIHKANECVKLRDVEELTDIYKQIIKNALIRI